MRYYLLYTKVLLYEAEIIVVSVSALVFTCGAHTANLGKSSDMLECSCLPESLL